MQAFIKQIAIVGLFALAALFTIAPTHAQTSDAEIQADLLQTRILSAIKGKDYAAADALFTEYDELGVVMPPPLQLHRAVVHVRLQQFYQAEVQLNALLKRVERGSADYTKAVQLLAEVAPKAAAELAADPDKAQAAAEAKAQAAAEAEAKARATRAEAAVVALAKDRGMPLSVTARDEDYNHTLLYWAAYEKNLAAAEWLLANGADVHAKDNDGFTPLHSAAGNDSRAVAELLLANGADVHAKNIGGYTPLHYAAGRKNRAVAELLLANGADVNAKNNGGDTPLDLAIFKDFDAVAALLRQYGGRCNTQC